MSAHTPPVFSRWRIITGIILIAISGWGIVSVRSYLNTLSIESLGPLVPVSGPVSSLEGDGNTLELEVEGQRYISVGPYSREFHRGTLVTSEVIPGDEVQLLTSQEPEGERIDFYRLSSQGVEWLTPEGHLAWQRSNTKAGLRLIWFVFFTGILILASAYRPLGNYLEEVADVAVWKWVLAKSWIGSIILLLAAIPAAKDCWLAWQMRDEAIHKATLVSVEETKWLGIFTRFPVVLQPDGTERTVTARGSRSIPDEVEFRWDGESDEVYLEAIQGSPWVNLGLLLAFAILGLLLSLVYRWAARQEGVT